MMYNTFAQKPQSGVERHEGERAARDPSVFLAGRDASWPGSERRNAISVDA